MSSRKRPHAALTPRTGTRLVQCPICSKHVHTLLLNDHLESCTLAGPPTTSMPLPPPAVPPPPPTSLPLPQPPPPPPPSAESEVSPAEAEALVCCPLCDLRLRNEDAFAHVEQCTGGANTSCSTDAGGSSSGSGGGSGGGGSSSSTSGDIPYDGGAGSSSAAHGAGTVEHAPSAESDTAVCCPACGVLCANNAHLNKHLDAGCSDPPASEPPSTASQLSADVPPATSALDQARLDRLAQELRCALCFDAFDDPHSLPCNHSFCLSCLMDCFRVTSTMACPLCKAPMWRRQVVRNTTLAGIVAAFRELERSHSEAVA